MSLPKDSTLNASVLRMAGSFTGAPYRSHTLDTDTTEHLITNLREFDCVTFLENAIALAQTRQCDAADWNLFCQNLTKLRYRQGQINGYASRLHYFCDWLYENEQKGILTILSTQLGGKPFSKKINAMSQHRDRYTPLKNQATLAQIKETEMAINLRKYTYIPKKKISGIEKQLKDGDLIAITSAEPGADISHTGFARRYKGRIYLLHASSDFHKVMLSERPLSEYLAQHPRQTGIMVARLLNR